MARKVQEMATATLEAPETEATATTESKKRKRVNVDELASQNPHEKVLLNIPFPAEMRVMLRSQAEQANVSEAQFVRDLVADRLGYEVPASFNERKHRIGQFSGLSDEEKKAKIAEANKAKREQVNTLLAAIAAGNIPTDKLAELGIDVSLLPKPRKAGDDDE